MSLPSAMLGLLVGLPLGMLVMVAFYSDRGWRKTLEEFRHLEASADGKLQPPANDCPDAPERARRAGW